jgi:hypothetical protein
MKERPILFSRVDGVRAARQPRVERGAEVRLLPSLECLDCSNGLAVSRLKRNGVELLN